ncbi:MAG: hypothetical protein ACE5GS_11865 [Kiloniellaceae bacterium]
MYTGKLLYPVVGTGSFIVLFLLGLSVGHNLGLHILSMLVLAFVCGSAGASLVVQLERRDRGH